MYSSYRWLILLIGCLALLLYGINLVLYVPLFGVIAKDLTIDMSACLNLSMAFVITQALSIAFGGILVDKLGLTVIYVGSLLCASVPAVLMPWIGHGYGIVFVSRLVQGSVAASFATIGPILAIWFPPREQGLAGGLMMCMASAGIAIGLVATPAVLGAAGTWQKTVAISSLPGWITMVLALLITRRRPPHQRVMAAAAPAQSGAERETYLNLLALPVTWLGTLIFFCNAWGIYTLYNVVPPYLATRMGIGLEASMAGRLSLLLPVMGVPAFFLGGLFFDKVAKGNSRLAIFIGFVMTGLSAYMLVFPAIYQNVILLSVALMITGFGAPFMGPSLSAFIAMNFRPHLVGSMVGLWFGLGSLGGALGIYLAGMVTAVTGSFVWVFELIGLVAAAGFLLTFALKPRVGQLRYAIVSS